MGEFLLDYADARGSEGPADTVLEFLEETYSAAADLAKWDRASLDRHEEVACAVRFKSSHEAFSDGVFVIIITIMVLDLRVPSGSSLEALQSAIPAFLSYVLSFVYIGLYRNNHHHLLHASERVSGPIL